MSSIFLLFGLLNNLLYVIILSAAVDMGTTPGLTSFFNICPSILTKVAVPYLISSRANYRWRIPLISICTTLGMLCVALSPTSVALRLFGIAITSLSSGGMGDITYLQLSSLYTHSNALAFYASGTGLAGVVGSASWLALRSLGTQRALLICALLPLLQPVAFLMLKQAKDADAADAHVPTLPLSLSLTEKKDIAKDVIKPYMIPLFAVYLCEYNINQGVAPALTYPANRLVKHTQDFYPTYQLIYQVGVFVSRSSHLLRLGTLPASKFAWPSGVQSALLGILILEAVYKLVGFYAVAALILLEGLMGGLSYVNVFHHTNIAYADQPTHVREFAVGLVSLSDGVGIALASLISIGLVRVLE